MYILTGFKKRFIQHGWLVLLALLIILLFVRLGFWQLERADEKKKMLATEQSCAGQMPFKWSEQDSNPADYQRIELSGRFLPFVFLLDNQHYQHQLGYHVLSPLLLSNQKIVLIDRGWVAGDMTRKTIPAVMNPGGRIKLMGAAYYPSSKKITLGSMIEKEEKKRVVIEWLDTEAISHFLQKSVYPFIIRLDKNQEHGFIRQWPVVSMPPERHYAYALQWFSMALVVFIVLIALSLRKKP